MITSRILSAVLRRIKPGKDTELRAGALSIEFVEVSRTAPYGDWTKARLLRWEVNGLRDTPKSRQNADARFATSIRPMRYVRRERMTCEE